MNIKVQVSYRLDELIEKPEIINKRIDKLMASIKGTLYKSGVDTVIVFRIYDIGLN